MVIVLSGGRRIGLEFISYLILIVGVFGDHLTTIIGLNRPYLYEANPFAATLIEMGLMLPFNIVLITLGILPTYFLVRWRKNGYFKIFFLYPLLGGIIRLGACFWNLSLLI